MKHCDRTKEQEAQLELERIQAKQYALYLKEVELRVQKEELYEQGKLEQENRRTIAPAKIKSKFTGYDHQLYGAIENDLPKTREEWREMLVKPQAVRSSQRSSRKSLSPSRSLVETPFDSEEEGNKDTKWVPPRSGLPRGTRSRDRSPPHSRRIREDDDFRKSHEIDETDTKTRQSASSLRASYASSTKSDRSASPSVPREHGKSKSPAAPRSAWDEVASEAHNSASASSSVELRLSKEKGETLNPNGSWVDRAKRNYKGGRGHFREDEDVASRDDVARVGGKSSLPKKERSSLDVKEYVERLETQIGTLQVRHAYRCMLYMCYMCATGIASCLLLCLCCYMCAICVWSTCLFNPTGITIV
jgi:hypothetical protein